jgi:hypothetical protein
MGMRSWEKKPYSHINMTTEINARRRQMSTTSIRIDKVIEIVEETLKETESFIASSRFQPEDYVFKKADKCRSLLYSMKDNKKLGHIYTSESDIRNYIDGSLLEIIVSKSLYN